MKRKSAISWRVHQMSRLISFSWQHFIIPTANTYKLIFHGINMLWYYCAIGFICCEIDTLSSLDTAIYFHFEKIQKTTRVETAEWKFWQISFLWHIENPFYGTKTYLSSFCCCCFHHRRNDVKIRVRFFSSFFLVFSQNNMGWHECGS